jgi:hypothetical protein
MQRLVPIFVAAAALGSCTIATPPPAGYAINQQAQFAQVLAGRVAGAPRRCLPHPQNSQIVAVNANTVAYRDGSTIWVSHTEGSCANLQSGYTLVVKSFGFSGPCRGDVAQVVDRSGMTGGSCFFGDFVPYGRVG